MPPTCIPRMCLKVANGVYGVKTLYNFGKPCVGQVGLCEFRQTRECDTPCRRNYKVAVGTCSRMTY